MKATSYPALILAPLGLLSGALGTLALGVGIGQAPAPGLYMILAGLWFGLVVALAVWAWGMRSLGAAATALVATWVAWELAVNLAMQIQGSWLKGGAFPPLVVDYISGFAAGALGAFVTWAGAAASAAALRSAGSAVAVTLTGALFGLLLPWTNHYDTGAVLLLPWQAAVAAMLGFGLSRKSQTAIVSGGRVPPQSSRSTTAGRRVRISSETSMIGL
jgi:hypothetical protein